MTKKIKLSRTDLTMKALGMKPGELYRVVAVTKPKRGETGWQTPASVVLVGVTAAEQLRLAAARQRIERRLATLKPVSVANPRTQSGRLRAGRKPGDGR